MAQKDGDLRKIEQLIKIMKKNDLVEVEIKHGEDKILLKRSQPQQPTMAAIPMINPSSEASRSAAPAPKEDDGLVEIKSPMLGTFYAIPSPDSEPFAEVGTAVTPQKVICIIEAMKVMNEIKAEQSGTIVEILVTNGQAVEYGQTLFKIKPA